MFWIHYTRPRPKWKRSKLHLLVYFCLILSSSGGFTKQESFTAGRDFFMMMGGPNGMNGRPNSRPGGSYPG